MDKATKHSHYLYNKNLHPLAGALRKNMTKAEACLWKYVLRACMVKGYTFNRQRPVIDYITDFFCKVEERENEVGFTSPRSPSPPEADQPLAEERGTLLYEEEQKSFHA